MSKILITGGAGFIGTALAKKLAKLKHNVSIIDIKDTLGDNENSSFEYYKVDVRDFRNFSVLEGQRFDFIFHLAAQTSGFISQQEPELDVDTNVKGTLNVCNFARECGTKKIIFSSSMAAYGDVEGDISETQPLNPISNYGVSKLAGEQYIKMFNQFHIESTIFRLFNVYGPGQDMFNLSQGMASIFMAQSISSNVIEVTGSFNRFRDFVYIDDVIEALILGLGENTSGETYNVGTGNATTVKELIDCIISVGDKPKGSIQVSNIGGHEGDQFGSVANSVKLQNLGWFPVTKLTKGMSDMYLFAKAVLK
jgi:UDP-glucose 4-epimerase